MPVGALVWSNAAERFFEAGVDHGVLYSQVNGVYNDGVAWNGLTNVTKSPSGAEPNPQYADNIKYLNLVSAEDFNGTIECFSAPRGFLINDGVRVTANGLQITQQSRPIFGFGWRSKKGNANDPDLGYVLHLAYGLQAAPSEKSHTTINDSPEATTFSWSVSSTPVPVTGYGPTALVEIDSTDPTVDPDNLAALELILYGSPGVAPRLPLPDEVDAILGAGVSVVTPTPLAFNAGTGQITYAPQAGVRYFNAATGVEITSNVTVPTGQTVVVEARPDSGYNFPTTLTYVTRWANTRP